MILKGGSEALNSNRILVKIISDAAEKNGVPKGAIQLIETRGTSSRNAQDGQVYQPNNP